MRPSHCSELRAERTFLGAQRGYRAGRVRLATTQPLGDRCGPGSPSREPSDQPGVSTDVCLLGMHAQREGGSRGSRGRQRAVGDGDTLAMVLAP